MISTWFCLRQGIDVLVRRFPLLFGAWLVILAVQQGIALVVPDTVQGLWISLALDIVLLAPLYAGQYLLALHVVRGEPTAFRDLFRGFRWWGALAAVSVLTSLLASVGFLLLIVPGIVWLVMFAFAPIVVLDRATGGAPTQRIGAVGAMRRSKELTAGYRATLFAISLLLSLPSVAVGTLAWIALTSPDTGIPLWTIEVLALLSGTLFLGPLHAASYMVAYDAITRLERRDQDVRPTVTLEEHATGE